MAEPYTIRIFVPDGDPEGVKIVNHLNWTGVGVAFPRSAWPTVNARPEFRKPGVYILTGFAEGVDDGLQTVYVGQGDEIGSRIASHYGTKDFWNWGYAFVSSGNPLNRAHITWLEHALLDLAAQARQCHLDNQTQPREPSLSEHERADTTGFLREMLRILPLLGVRVFERAALIVTPGSKVAATQVSEGPADERDTIIVPAQEEGFKRVFLGENCWYYIRIAGGMLPKIKYVAAYQSQPISAITHYAPVDRIELYGEDGKYRLVFSEPAKALPKPIPFGDAPAGAMQGIRYTSLAKLLRAKRVVDLMSRQVAPSED